MAVTTTAHCAASRAVSSAWAGALGFALVTRTSSPTAWRVRRCSATHSTNLGHRSLAEQRRSEHLDGGAGARNEILAPGGTFESDSDRNTLGQPHPVESRIDVGEECCAGTAIVIFDARRNAFHASAQHTVAAHQPHVHGISDMNARQLGFLEIALDVQRV